MLNSDDYLTLFHEIKNSISLIGSSLQLIEKKHPEVHTFDYWAETMGEVASLRNMVTQLSSAHLCTNPQFQQVNLSVYMEEISHAIAALSDKNFYCEITFEDPLPPVEFDPQLIKQALLNLIKNSYEAMGQTGTVQFVLSLREAFLQIQLIDHGGGLDPALADAIFEPFITSKTGGSGLGLVITKQIIESHHGTITCTSRTGDGCTFTIMLPVFQQHS